VIERLAPHLDHIIALKTLHNEMKEITIADPKKQAISTHNMDFFNSVDVR